MLLYTEMWLYEICTRIHNAVTTLIRPSFHHKLSPGTLLLLTGDPLVVALAAAVLTPVPYPLSRQEPFLPRLTIDHGFDTALENS